MFSIQTNLSQEEKKNADPLFLGFKEICVASISKGLQNLSFELVIKYKQIFIKTDNCIC